MVAGLVAAAYVVALYLVRPVPDWAIEMFGGPSRPLDRHGGLALTFRPAPGQEAAFDAYVADRASSTRKQGGSVIVEIPGVPKDAAMETIEMLQYGGLTMTEVVRTNYAAEIGEHEGVTLEVDQWYPEDGSGTRTDTFLKASSGDALEAALAGWQAPAGTELVFEWVEPGGYRPNEKPYMRTYLVKTVAEIDGSMIANASSSHDPNTGRPVVLLDFTRAGGDKFCELTTRIVGEKLATMTGNRVRSAPIINSRICGGRASVTMGGSEPIRQEQEADALVAVLRSGAMPKGTIEEQSWKPAANITREAWLARLLFGLIAAFAATLAVFGAVRLVKPTLRTAPRPAGKLPWGRVAVTALAPITLLVASNLSLPGLNEAELAHILRRPLDTQESIIALGLTPIITGYLLVELVALAWPALRWRRHDPRGRAGLGRAAAAVSIAVALVQGYFVASHWDQFGAPMLGFGGGVEITAHHGWTLKILYMVTLAAGTMGLALIAGIIREHGLGNGYAALFATGYLFELAAPYTREGYENFYAFVTMPSLVGAIGGIAIVIATRALLRWRVDQLRMPACGVAPIGDSQAIIMMLVMLASLGLSGFESTLTRYYALTQNTIAHAVILFASVPVWSWLFARPRLLVGVSYGTWLRATALTLVMFVAVWYVGALYALSVMVITAAALDILDDLRAHRDKLAIAGVVHQAQYVGMLERALDDANIPVHFHASHIRTLFAFFGAWAPILVMVPEAHLEAASKLVYATITKEHHAVVQAFARDARPTPGRRLVPAWARMT
jgi:SecY